jgi:hypothetical protein
LVNEPFDVELSQDEQLPLGVVTYVPNIFVRFTDRISGLLRVKSPIPYLDETSAQNKPVASRVCALSRLARAGSAPFAEQGAQRLPNVDLRLRGRDRSSEDEQHSDRNHSHRSNPPVGQMLRPLSGNGNRRAK